MPVQLGMNGFGRIGRYLLRLLADDQDLQIAAINARADNAALAYLFKYDSTYGVFPGEVDHDQNGIIVNGRHIAVTRCKAGEWEWRQPGRDPGRGNHRHHQGPGRSCPTPGLRGRKSGDFRSCQGRRTP